MTILCIETSTNVCSAAVTIGGVPIAERISREGGNHAKLLPVFIDELLQEVHTKGLEIEGVALSAGPGSYTGLRIGTSTAKGLCYGLNIPLIPIPTLQVLCAAAVSKEGTKMTVGALLCPMIASQLQERTEAERKQRLRYGIVGVVSFLCIMELLSLMNYHLDICRYKANSRPYGYFASRWEETQYYCDAVDEIKGKGYQLVGLYVVKGDAYQYPLWAMLGDRHLEHVNVQNNSAVYADESFTPDCIIWFAAPPEEPVTINGRVYDQICDFGENHYLLYTE